MEKSKDKVIFDGDPNLKNCGHYKKDTPHKDIGLQKFRIPVRLIVDANFIIVSKDLPRAKELLSNVYKKIKNIDFGDQYDTDKDVKLDHGTEEMGIETVYSNQEHYKQYKVEEIPIGGNGGVEKIEECIPYEETFYPDKEDDRKEHDGKLYDNNDDPWWEKDEFDWRKNEDGTNIDENKK